MIAVLRGPDWLCFAGHAKAEVCAQISLIVFTMARAQTAYDVRHRALPDNVKFIRVGKRVAKMLPFVDSALRALAIEYPRHVRVKFTKGFV